MKLCDFSYIIYLNMHKKTGFDSVVLKVCKKKKSTTLVAGQPGHVVL